MPFALMNLIFALTGGEVAADAALDFSEPLTSALGNVASSFGKYALIAIPIGLGIWAAPKAVKMIMKFFNSLTH